mmetsp:Transcript_27687/g.70120  ORF Transcript_27687/g.70120 Transcript_27687/m.70120 type:complete len:104 (-) Transcript_27687:1370-1681(-)
MPQPGELQGFKGPAHNSPMSPDKLWASWKSYCLKPERTWPSTAPFKEREACKDGSTHAKYMQSKNSTPDAMKSRRLAALSSAPSDCVQSADSKLIQFTASKGN